MNAVPTRCGVVAVVGAPNAGKSTLVNLLVGSKVTIVTAKVQTTRARVMGVAMRDLADGVRAQIVLVDTPGIFNARNRRLERAMVASAWKGAEEADLVMPVIDANRGLNAEIHAILERLRKRPGPKVMVLNKIDLLAREKLLALAAAAHEALPTDRVFMVSATKGHGVGDLLDYLAAAATPGPFLFPEDQTSDMPMRLLAAEIVREQVFMQLHEELPYDITVETENWQERKDGSARVDCVVFVAREGQRAIALGKGGAKIKLIGARARRELGGIMGRPVHLFLQVKLREKWSEERARYSQWGLDFDV